MCVSPISVVVKRRIYFASGTGMAVPRSYQVPCGHCSECIKKRATSWGVRAYRESLKSPMPRFITLTYDNAHLPRTSLGNPTLSRLDVNKWLKNFRAYWYYRGYTLRFFLSAEYGSKKGRPHYHFLIYGLPIDITCKEVQSVAWDLWRKCVPKRLTVEFPKYGSSSGFYLGKYCGKSTNRYVASVLDKDKEFIRAFKRASIGFGADFSQSEKDFFLAKDMLEYRRTRPFGYKSPALDMVEFGSLFDSQVQSVPKSRVVIPDLAIPASSDYKAVKSLKWFLEVCRRYKMCQRPTKSGGFINVAMPTYLAEKLYGRTLFRMIKSQLRYEYDKAEADFADFGNVLAGDKNATVYFRRWLNLRDSYYRLGGRYELIADSFELYMRLEHSRLRGSSDFFRVKRESENLSDLYINDVF